MNFLTPHNKLNSMSNISLDLFLAFYKLHKLLILTRFIYLFIYNNTIHTIYIIFYTNQ